MLNELSHSSENDSFYLVQKNQKIASFPLEITGLFTAREYLNSSLLPTMELSIEYDGRSYSVEQFIQDVKMLDRFLHSPDSLLSTINLANLNKSKKMVKSKPQPITIEPADLETAHQLFEIKQSSSQRSYLPNFSEWATDVAKIRRLKIPGADGQLHQITHDEIILAFRYAFQVNQFWSLERIIVSPQSLFNQLNRKRKTTFKDSYIDWLSTGGVVHETRRPNYRTQNAQESVRRAIDAAFA